MEIEVRKLNALKRYEGTVDFDYTPLADICLIPLCEITGTVKVTAVYVIFEDNSVEVNLTVDYLLKGQCSYCLKDAEKRITFSQTLLFLTEKDDENYYYDGIKINLETAVNDAILISQPNVLLCKEDCKGIDVT